MRTVEQAKAMWCPYGVAPGKSNAGINRGDEKAESECRCIATECMAWRWDLSWLDEEIRRVKRSQPNLGDTEIIRQIKDAGALRGFCGAFGLATPEPK